MGTLIAGLLGIMLVAFKCLGIISWSWWLILLPFYGGLVIGLFILICVALLWIAGALVKK